MSRILRDIQELSKNFCSLNSLLRREKQTCAYMFVLGMCCRIEFLVVLSLNARFLFWLVRADSCLIKVAENLGDAAARKDDSRRPLAGRTITHDRPRWCGWSRQYLRGGPGLVLSVSCLELLPYPTCQRQCNRNCRSPFRSVAERGQFSGRDGVNLVPPPERDGGDLVAWAAIWAAVEVVSGGVQRRGRWCWSAVRE
jgi:hypothetical protein